MNIDINDPKWTDYALGEITDERERMEMEAVIRQSPEIAAMVEEIRDTAGWLKEELAAEPAEQLTPAQRERIEEKAAKAAKSSSGGFLFGWKPAWVYGCAAFAVILIAFIAVRTFRQTDITTTEPAFIAEVPEKSAPESVTGVDIDKVVDIDSEYSAALPSALSTVTPVAPVQTPIPSDGAIIAEKKTAQKSIPQVSAATSTAVEIASAQKTEGDNAPRYTYQRLLEVATGVDRAMPENTASQTGTQSAAQNGGLRGTITDATKAVISNASVTVKDLATNAVSKATTDYAGRFALLLQPGEYEVKVEASTFVPDVKKIRVRLEPLSYNVVLRPGAATETVSVKTDAYVQLLEESPYAGTVLQEDSLLALPILTGNVMDLINVMGGVQLADDPLFGAGATTFAGVPASGTNIQRDGNVNSGIAQAPKAAGGSFVGSVSSGAGIGIGTGRGIGVSKAQSPPPPPAVSAKSKPGSGAAKPAPSSGYSGGNGAPAELSYNSGIATAQSMNVEMLGEMKMVLSAQDAEYGFGTGPIQPQGARAFNTEDYKPIIDNSFLDAAKNPLSTFSIDVDTASYSNMRRFLDNGRMPPADSIRVEELVNYFDYNYKAPTDGKPFAANVEMTEAPWNPRHKLLRIGLKGRELDNGKRPESNLVFLIDVSGSMDAPNRLPLVKDAMAMLVDRLTESDRVAIVTYANDVRLLLPSTSGDQKAKIGSFIYGLRASGGTNGGAAIQMAYRIAEENFIKGGVNRVILATDGDFNIGITNRGDLARLIEEKAKSGVFLSALGFGMGNYKDTTLEMLADKGRGNYAYIDNEREARKVLVEQINSTLVAIAKDVKIQVEFNPLRVKSYRLIGYEDRVMAKEDFNNDAKMAGVIGAGHAVTAFYELELAGTPEAKSGAKSGAKSDAKPEARPDVDPLRYQKPPQASAAADSPEIALIKIRSKEPEKETSVLTEFVITEGSGRFANASGDFKFAAAVAAFGMVLRDSPNKGNADYQHIIEWAQAGKGEDRYGYREEFIRLIHRAAAFPRR